jgi:hypothetical protein
MHKGDLRGARSDFREVLSAEPNNRQAREELRVSGSAVLALNWLYN